MGAPDQNARENVTSFRRARVVEAGAVPLHNVEILVLSFHPKGQARIVAGERRQSLGRGAPAKNRTMAKGFVLDPNLCNWLEEFCVAHDAVVDM